jgi:PTH1 family peptidyl-tRNA hydrolase
MKIIAGLGNPGREYQQTRHNVGFEVIAKLAYDYNIDMNKSKFKAVMGEGRIGFEKVVLLQPITYMNLSGECLREAVAFYKCDKKDIIIVCDDINLPLGDIRIRAKGTDGGQKGLRSIMYQLGYDDFTRVRVGVGEKPAQWDLKDFVLSRFSEEERPDIIKGITDAADAVAMIAKADGETREAMNRYNKKGSKSKKEAVKKDDNSPTEA